MTDNKDFILYQYQESTIDQIIDKSWEFLNISLKRRSIREFSDKPIPDEVIDNLIRTAATSPSGANKQPWFFCIVKSAEMKKKIREEAEKIEFRNYDRNFSDEMKDDFKKLKTNYEKKYLEEAPVLIVVFKEKYGKNGEKNYFVTESVGIAIGLLITAIHQSGLVSLCYSPAPMNFLSELLQRPENESAMMIIPVGFPKEGTMIPALDKKNLEDITFEY